MLIINFKNKQEILDVIRILTRGKYNLSYIDDNFYSYKKLVDEKVEEIWLENILILTNNFEFFDGDDDNWFCFVSKKEYIIGQFITSQNFIFENKSTTWIVLNELMNAKGKVVTYSKLKKLLSKKSKNALFDSLYELEKMWCDISRWYWRVQLFSKPSTVVIWFNKVYSWIWKKNKLEKLIKWTPIDNNTVRLYEEFQRMDLNKQSPIRRIINFIINLFK